MKLPRPGAASSPFRHGDERLASLHDDRLGQCQFHPSLAAVLLQNRNDTLQQAPYHRPGLGFMIELVYKVPCASVSPLLAP